MFAINQLVGIIVMLVAGTLGGYVGAILSRFSPPEDGNRVSVSTRESALAGIAAAFIVPVFLSIASLGANSSLIDTVFQPIGACSLEAPSEPCRGYVPSLLLLAAFCIVVGASYRAFFTGISQRLLESLKDKVQALSEDVQNLEEEPEIEAPVAGQPPKGATALPTEQGAVLDALIKKPRTRRAVGAIALDKNMKPLEVKDALSSLVKLGLAEESESRTTPGTKRFRIDVDALSTRVQRDPETEKFFVK